VAITTRSPPSSVSTTSGSEGLPTASSATGTAWTTPSRKPTSGRFARSRVFRGDARIGTWLFRITYNACLDELARKRKVTHVPLDELVEQASGEPEPGDALQARRDLATSFAALSKAERAVVFLVDVQGFDYSGAAELLEVPVGTVASRLNRARRSLRSGLRPTGEGFHTESENLTNS
jgi:RNA polymerase sigma-70 factor (ECF subfamily)